MRGRTLRTSVTGAWRLQHAAIKPWQHQVADGMMTATNLECDGAAAFGFSLADCALSPGGSPGNVADGDLLAGRASDGERAAQESVACASGYRNVAESC